MPPTLFVPNTSVPSLAGRRESDKALFTEERSDHAVLHKPKLIGEVKKMAQLFHEQREKLRREESRRKS
jgi:hypothetical protein